MEPPGTQRRLAAILASDMVGYSRLIEADEEGTLARQKNFRKELIDPTIAAYHGRIVKSTGDGLLVEFPSVVDAFRCAVSVQLAMSERESQVPEAQRIAYRIGINSGDIVIDEDDIYGDGVNIAARLEALAEPGGICVSRTVFDQIKSKVNSEFESIGAQRVKNIAEPIPVYRVQMQPEAAATDYVGLSGKRTPLRWAGITVMFAVIIAVAGTVYWSSQTQKFEPSSVTHTADALSNELSIAVLPFANMSDDPEQQYFADGITEDIITDFSRLSNLKVIAWNTSSSYKDRAVQPQEVGKELGVAYVLDGSVRKSGDRLRITAQLVDARDGSHVWAERYDRKLSKIFELQDEVTEKIVSALGVRLTVTEKKELGRLGTNNIAAYDWFLRGLRYARQRTKEGNELARNAFRNAIDLDPAYARAYGALAVVLTHDYRNDWGELSLEEARARALELAEKAVALDGSLPQAHWALGFVYLFRRQYDEAAAAAEKAVALAPNYADGHGLLAFINNFRGRAADAVHNIRKAMALNPYYSYEYPWNLGRAYYNLGRYAEAVDALYEANERNENALYPRLFLAATYVRLGQQEDAAWEIEQIKILNPGTTLTHLANTFPIKNQNELNAFLEDLRKAGLPN